MTDFVVKPVGAERLQVSLCNALAASALEGHLARIKRSRANTPLRDSAAPVPGEAEAPRSPRRRPSLPSVR